jgi:bifunctional non-homologous end joining protein LigD
MVFSSAWVGSDAALVVLRDALAASLSGHQVGLDGVVTRRVPGRDVEGAAVGGEWVYVVFDVLYLDGEDLTAVSYRQRRAILRGLDMVHPFVHELVVDRVEDPDDLRRRARARGYGGVVAKRLDAPYRSGTSADWIEVVVNDPLEVVVGGWVPRRAGRGDGISGLLVGRPRPGGGSDVVLDFLGVAESGWNVRNSRYLRAMLTTLARATRPFADPVPAELGRHAIWVSPHIVGEVEYRTTAAGGVLRGARWTRVLPGRVVADLVI